MIELFATNKVSIPIAQIFELKDAEKAHRLVESRNYQGKILLRVGDY